MRLYSELAPWFHLLTHPKDYAEEAADYTRLILEAVPGARTLLELGSGGGNNASHMKRHFTCTLTDLSPEMLAISREINPGCAHSEGDMRTLRLGRQFDAVFIHDAIDYILTLEDLARTAATAFVHTRPDGVAILVPDHTRETFVPSADHGGHDGDDGRSLRYLEWTLDFEPGATTTEMHFAILVKDAAGVRLEHDVHTFAVFSRAEWVSVLEGAGFTVETPELDPEVHEEQVLFVCRRPD